MSKAPIRVLTALSLSAAAVKLALVLTTGGTNDIHTLWLFNRTNREFGVRAVYQHLPCNYPPLSLAFLRLCDGLEQATGLAFSGWLRILQIAADAGSIYLIYRISHAAFGDHLRFAPLWLVAIAPGLVFVSGFHGNVDAVMMFLVLLAVYFITLKNHAWLAGVALGLSCSIKQWPIVLAPVFFWHSTNWVTCGRFVGAFGATVFVAALPVIVEEPGLIVGRVVGYNSAPGCWGITRLLGFVPSLALWNVAYTDHGRYIAAGAIVVAACLMNRLRVRPPLFAQCGIATHLFMALTPGFGVQYIAWLIPWLAWSRGWYALTFHVASGLFLFVVYTFWSRGLPWHVADAAVGPWPPLAITFEVICWGLVVLYVVNAAYTLNGRQSRSATLTVADDRDALSVPSDSASR